MTGTLRIQVNGASLFRLLLIIVILVFFLKFIYTFMTFFLLFLQLDIFPDTDSLDELLTSNLTVIVKVEY